MITTVAIIIRVVVIVIRSIITILNQISLTLLNIIIIIISHLHLSLSQFLILPITTIKISSQALHLAVPPIIMFLSQAVLMGKVIRHQQVLLGSQLPLQMLINRCQYPQARSHRAHSTLLPTFR